MTAPTVERYSGRYSARYCERTSGAEIEIDHRGRDRGRGRDTYRALSVVVRCKFESNPKVRRREGRLDWGASR